MAILLILCQVSWAQVQINARVDRETVGLDETVELTVTVAGAGMGAEPSVPTLTDFRLLGTATQQSISLINGQMQSSTNYVYHLKPRRAGDLVIPTIKVTVRGRVYRTSPIPVTVSESAAPAPGPSVTPGAGLDPFGGLPTGQPAAVKHSVDRKTAYVGQQITYTFSFLQAEQLYGDVSYSPADTPGFVAEELPKSPNTTQTIDGRPHSVQRRLKALFPTSPGKHTIGQASVTVTMDPFLGEEELVAKPITVTVLPLPTTGQPANFSGAVGNFQIRLRADRNVLRAGETVNCVVEITGDGNIRAVGAPNLTLPDWVRVYKAGENRKLQPGGGNGGQTTVGGTARFSYLLLPRQAGTLRLGPIRYSVFDPVRRAYRTITSQALDITVTPGTGAAVPVEASDALRPVKQELGRRPLQPVVASPLFWLLVALPLPVLGWLAWQRRQEALLVAAPTRARAGRALNFALERLDQAERALAQGDLETFYAGVLAAMLDYVADRTSAPTSGLTADSAHDLLVEHGSDPALAQTTRGLIERAAAGRFAPGGSEARRAEQLLAECRQMLRALQGQVRPDA